MRLFGTLLILMLLIISCDSARIYEDFLKVDNSIWSAGDTKIFEVPITDTTLRYQVYINIRNSTKYEYSNLWVFFTIKAPNGQYKKDTFEIILANEQGEWRGSGLGNVNTVQEPYLARPVKFPDMGIYTFTIQQAMRKEELGGIMDVGLRIESQ